MKKMQAMITDLHYDLLKIIMLFVVKSSKGGVHLARAISVNRDFAKFANDEDVLRAANFDNLGLSDHYESYQCIHGLINKCSQAGNVTAQYMLSKIILVTSSQLWKRASKDLIGLASISLVAEKDTTASFMAHFMADQASTSKRSGGSLTHAELVRLFVLLCGLVDFVTMRPHLDNYFKYFFGSVSGSLNFFYSINGMSSILQAVVHLGKKGKMWYPCQKLKGFSVESGEGNRGLNALCIDLGERLFHCPAKLMEIDFKREEFHETYAPSSSNLKELKRECNDIAEQLIPVKLGKRKKEANIRYIDLGERFFYYLVKHWLTFKEAVIQETNELSSSTFRELKKECKDLGRVYESHRRNATFALDDIFFHKNGF
ncbi:hypothetical protein CsSME_00053701 [Camellia sinensis var. sinensis]